MITNKPMKIKILLLAFFLTPLAFASITSWPSSQDRASYLSWSWVSATGASFSWDSAWSWASYNYIINNTWALSLNNSNLDEVFKLTWEMSWGKFVDVYDNTITLPPVLNQPTQELSITKNWNSSIKFNWWNQVIMVESWAHLNMWTWNFTFETWVYFNSAPWNTYIYDFNNSQWILMLQSWNFDVTNGAWTIIIRKPFAPTAQVWHHLALVRDGWIATLYYDWWAIWSWAIAWSYWDNKNLKIWAYWTDSDTNYRVWLNWYLDDFTITKRAKYISNFAIPTSNNYVDNQPLSYWSNYFHLLSWWQEYVFNINRAPRIVSISYSIIRSEFDINWEYNNLLADSYNLYYSTNPWVTIQNWTKISNINWNQYSLWIGSQTGYYFVVTAVKNWVESWVSNELQWTTVITSWPSSNDRTSYSEWDWVSTWSISFTWPNTWSWDVYNYIINQTWAISLETQDDSLIWYYKFEWNGIDSSWYWNNWTLNWWTFSNNWIKWQSYFLSNSYVTIPATSWSLMDITWTDKSFSLSVWAKRTSVWTWQWIIWRWSPWTNQSLYLWYDDINRICLDFYYTPWVYSVSTYNNANEWHNISATYDWITNQLKLYYDWNPILTTVTPSDSFASWNLYIWRSGWGNYYPWYLDDVKIWNKVLTLTEIRNNYYNIWTLNTYVDNLPLNYWKNYFHLKSTSLTWFNSPEYIYNINLSPKLTSAINNELSWDIKINWDYKENFTGSIKINTLGGNPIYTTWNSYLMTNLINNQTYSFNISAIEDGIETQISNTIVATSHNSLSPDYDWTVRASCTDHLNSNPLSHDWIYIIKPDPNLDQVPAYCDMTTDWGGWTLILIDNINATKSEKISDSWTWSIDVTWNSLALYKLTTNTWIHLIWDLSIRLNSPSTWSSYIIWNPSKNYYSENIWPIKCKSDYLSKYTNWGIASHLLWFWTSCWLSYNYARTDTTLVGITWLKIWAKKLTTPTQVPQITSTQWRYRKSLIAFDYSDIFEEKVTSYSLYVSSSPWVTKTNSTRMWWFTGSYLIHTWIQSWQTLYYRMAANNLNWDWMLSNEVAITEWLSLASTFDWAVRTSCTDHYNMITNAQDWLYPIDMDWKWSSPEVEAYCDMTTDWGGWTLILNDRLLPSSEKMIDAWTWYITPTWSSSTLYKLTTSANIHNIWDYLIREKSLSIPSVYLTPTNFNYYTGYQNWQYKCSLTLTWAMTSPYWSLPWYSWLSHYCKGNAQYTFATTWATAYWDPTLSIWVKWTKCNPGLDRCKDSEFRTLDENYVLLGKEWKLSKINIDSKKVEMLNLPSFKNFWVASDTSIYISTWAWVQQLNLSDWNIISTIWSIFNAWNTFSDLSSTRFWNTSHILYDKWRNASYVFDKANLSLDKIDFNENKVISLAKWIKPKVDYSLSFQSDAFVSVNEIVLKDWIYHKWFVFDTEWQNILGSNNINSFSDLIFDFWTTRNIERISFLNRRSSSHTCDLKVRWYSWDWGAWNQVYTQDYLNWSYDWLDKWREGYEDYKNSFDKGRSANVYFWTWWVSTSKIKISIATSNSLCIMWTDEIIVDETEAPVWAIWDITSMALWSSSIYLASRDEVYSYHLGLWTFSKISWNTSSGISFLDEISDKPSNEWRFYYIKWLYSSLDWNWREVLYVNDIAWIRKIDENYWTWWTIYMMNRYYIDDKWQEQYFWDVFPITWTDNFLYSDDSWEYKTARFSNITLFDDTIPPSIITWFTVSQDISTNDIIFNFTAPWDNSDFWTSYSYEIVYSTSSWSIFDWMSGPYQIITQNLKPKISWTQESIIASNTLSPNTQHYFWIRAYDESWNKSSFSSLLTLTTAQVQSTLSGSIAWTIKDSSQSILIWAEVIAYSKSSNAYYKAISDQAWFYSFSWIKPWSDYKITIKPAQSSIASQENFPLTFLSKSNSWIDFSLSLGWIISWNIQDFDTSLSISWATVNAFSELITWSEWLKSILTNSNWDFAITWLKNWWEYQISIYKSWYIQNILSLKYVAMSTWTSIWTQTLKSWYQLWWTLILPSWSWTTPYANKNITLQWIWNDTYKQVNTNSSWVYLFTWLKALTYKLIITDWIYSAWENSITLSSDNLSNNKTLYSDEQKLRINLKDSSWNALKNIYSSTWEILTKYSFVPSIIKGDWWCFLADFDNNEDNWYIIVNNIKNWANCQLRIEVTWYWFKETDNIQVTKWLSDYQDYIITIKQTSFNNRLFSSVQSVSPWNSYRLTALYYNNTSQDINNWQYLIWLHEDTYIKDVFVWNERIENRFYTPNINKIVNIPWVNIPSHSTWTIVYIVWTKESKQTCIWWSCVTSPISQYLTNSISIWNEWTVEQIWFVAIKALAITLESNQSITWPQSQYVIYGNTLANVWELEIILHNEDTNIDTVLKKDFPTSKQYKYIFESPAQTWSYSIFARLNAWRWEYTTPSITLEVKSWVPAIDKIIVISKWLNTIYSPTDVINPLVFDWWAHNVRVYFKWDISVITPLFFLKTKDWNQIFNYKNWYMETWEFGWNLEEIKLLFYN